MASKIIKKEIQEPEEYFTLIQSRLLELLKEKGPMTRDEICEEFGFEKHKVIIIDKYLLREKGFHYHTVREQYDKRTTIHDNLVKLQRRKLVEKFSKGNGKRGRPPVFFKLMEGK